MPDEKLLQAELERLYESPALREDLEDREAEVLLKWAETQVARLAAQDTPDFEQQCRFLRQMVKGINRFVGQREFEDAAGHASYMEKVVMWLPKLSYPPYTVAELLAPLPADNKDMAGTLAALLQTLTPTATPAVAPTPPQETNPLDALRRMAQSHFGQQPPHKDENDG
jgi:hypothetical protein